MDRTIYLPHLDTVNLVNADAYIRSAFTIPKRATVENISNSPDIVIARYLHNGLCIGQFWCYSMRDHKSFKAK